MSGASAIAEEAAETRSRSSRADVPEIDLNDPILRVRMRTFAEKWAVERGIRCAAALATLPKVRAKTVRGYRYEYPSWRWHITGRVVAKVDSSDLGVLLLQLEQDLEVEFKVIRAFLLPRGEIKWGRQIDTVQRQRSQSGSWLDRYQIWP